MFEEHTTIRLSLDYKILSWADQDPSQQRFLQCCNVALLALEALPVNTMAFWCFSMDWWMVEIFNAKKILDLLNISAMVFPWDYVGPLLSFQMALQYYPGPSICEQTVIPSNRYVPLHNVNVVHGKYSNTRARSVPPLYNFIEVQSNKLHISVVCN